MADDDAMWQRGSNDVPPPPAITFDSFTFGDDAGGVHEVDLPAPDSGHAAASAADPRRRWLIGFAAIVALGLAAVVVAGRLGGDDRVNRPDFDALAGADARRLPSSAERLWSATIDATGFLDISPPPVLIDGRAALITILDTDDFDGSLGVAFDPVTGDELWRRPFEFTSKSANFLGVIDGMLIVERNDLDTRQLLGVDTSTGDLEWSFPTRDNGVHTILSGTKLITRVSFTGNERLTFVDPDNGDEVARIEGRLISTDLSGTWYVLTGRRIRSLDLSDGFAEPIDIVTDVAIGNRTTAVVDGRVIVVDTDGTLAEIDPGADEPGADAGSDPDSESPDAFIALVAVGADLPNLVSLVATGGPTFMAIGDGQVLGATLDGTDVRINWTASGSVGTVDVTTTGLLVGVSTAVGLDDPGEVLVIDGVTGEQLAASDGTREPARLPQLLGDGFVTTDASGLGLERVGYDLDGDEQWRLASNTPVQVGDRIVATASVGPDGFTITAFGDAT